jgi:hypothetical protein
MSAAKVHSCDWQEKPHPMLEGEGIYGDAVDLCYEDSEGKLWVTNGDRGNQVNYCCWCGYKAPQQIAVR